MPCCSVACFFADIYLFCRIFRSGGNKTGVSYFDINEKPVVVDYWCGQNFLSCARWTTQYDTAGNIIEETYYDENNKIIDY